MRYQNILGRSSVYATRTSGPFTFEMGGLLSGLAGSAVNLNAESQTAGYADSGVDLLTDEIYWFDAWVARAVLLACMVHFCGAQGGYQGLVADAGPEQDQRFTGWTLRNSGRGNHWHTASGLPSM